MLDAAVITPMTSEWTAACEVQRRFMQHDAPAPAALDYSAHCRQVRDLGGDFYDFVPLAGGRLAFAIGDASGKGLPAALMISNVQSSLRTAILFSDRDLAAALRAVSRQVYSSSLDSRYATMLCGIIDPATHTLRYVNAGHPPAILLRANASVSLESNGAPVGLFADSSYEETTMRIDPGDVLIACTDGITECVDLDSISWNSDPRRALAAATVGAIFRYLDNNNGDPFDDATAAVLRML